MIEPQNNNVTEPIQQIDQSNQPNQPNQPNQSIQEVKQIDQSIQPNQSIQSIQLPIDIKNNIPELLKSEKGIIKIINLDAKSKENFIVKFDITTGKIIRSTEDRLNSLESETLLLKSKLKKMQHEMNNNYYYFIILMIMSWIVLSDIDIYITMILYIICVLLYILVLLFL